MGRNTNKPQRQKLNRHRILMAMGPGMVAALAGAGSWFGSRFANLDAFVGPVALVAIGSLILIYLWRVFTWKPRG